MIFEGYEHKWQQLKHVWIISYYISKTTKNIDILFVSFAKEMNESSQEMKKKERERKKHKVLWICGKVRWEPGDFIGSSSENIYTHILYRNRHTHT